MAKEKKYVFEVIDQEKNCVLRVCSDNPAYIMRRRNKEMYSGDGCIFERYFGYRQLVNGEELWDYDSRANRFIF